MGRFNGYLKATLVTINELHDLGDIKRVTFYEGTKWMLASPPATLRIDEKNIREYHIPNVCGVVGTTNHKVDGLYLTPADRRHLVAWSPLEESPKTPEEWDAYYRWLDEEGGAAHIAAYLDAVDLTGFNPKAPPRKTDAFWQIVTASRQPDESELALMARQYTPFSRHILITDGRSSMAHSTSYPSAVESRAFSRRSTLSGSSEECKKRPPDESIDKDNRRPGQQSENQRPRNERKAVEGEGETEDERAKL